MCCYIYHQIFVSNISLLLKFYLLINKIGFVIQITEGKSSSVLLLLSMKKYSYLWKTKEKRKSNIQAKNKQAAYQQLYFLAKQFLIVIEILRLAFSHALDQL